MKREKIMKRIIVTTAVILAFLGLSGCASMMRESQNQQLAGADDNRAKVVFMRSSFVAGAIGVELFDVTDGELKFIGQLPSGNKVVYDTTPGDKVFMAYGTAADFMTANLVGGKTYYSIVRPNWGTGGFAPTPIRKDGPSESMKSKEFSDWMSGTKRIEPTEEAGKWFIENKARYQAIYADYWARFQRKNDSEKAQRRLNADDWM